MEIANKTKFKKDFVAGFAIIFFIIIVFCEIMLAVWLPVHLRTTDIWGLQVARQDMIDLFDSLRRGFNSITGNARIEGEAKLIAKNLDTLAIYIRDYQADLNQNQIAEIRKDLDDLQVILENLKNGIVYTTHSTLDTTKFIERLANTAIKPPTEK